MARLARVVAPGLPHHLTQRGNRRQQVPSRYRWSSAAAHVRGRDDTVVRVAPLLALAPNCRAFLARVIRDEDVKLLRNHEHTGRPLGEEAFLATLEKDLGRILKRQKPGPKGKLRN